MDKKFLSKSQWNKFISFLREGENSNLRGKDKNFFFFFQFFFTFVCLVLGILKRHRLLYLTIFFLFYSMMILDFSRNNPRPI